MNKTLLEECERRANWLSVARRDLELAKERAEGLAREWVAKAKAFREERDELDREIVVHLTARMADPEWPNDETGQESKWRKRYLERRE